MTEMTAGIDEKAADTTAAPETSPAEPILSPAAGGDTKAPDPATRAEPGAADQAETSGTGWPDDWRTRLAGTDDSLLKSLNRFTSLESLAKSWREQRAELSRRAKAVDVPGPDASPEEVAAYRSAMGIPETPDKYEIKAPEQLAQTDADKAILADMAKAAHEMNIPPPRMQALADKFFDLQARQAEAMNVAAVQKAKTAEAMLKREYGADYDFNRTLAANVGTRVLGNEGFHDLINTQLADGTLLGDNPAMVRMLVQLARDTADDDMLAQAANTAPDPRSVDEQLREIMDMRFKDPARYASPEVQERAARLAKAKHARR